MGHSVEMRNLFLEGVDLEKSTRQQMLNCSDLARKQFSGIAMPEPLESYKFTLQVPITRIRASEASRPAPESSTSLLLDELTIAFPEAPSPVNHVASSPPYICSASFQ